MTSAVISSAPTAARRLTRVSAWALFVWVGTGIYAIALSLETIDRYHRFVPGFDAAIEDQYLWLAANGHDLYSTILDRSLLAGHFQPGLLLLTPLYWIGLGISALFVVQALSLALVAPALYGLARDRGASPMLASIPALLWLASPYTASVNLFEFHPEVFVPGLLVLGVLATFRERWGVLAATAALAMSFKEDVPLVYVMLGLILVLGGRRRAGAILAGASAFVFVVAHEVVLHSGNTYTFFGERFAGARGDTVGEAAVWMLEHPARTVVDVVDQSGWVIFLLFVATAGLAVLAPRWLLLALPTLAHNALSAYPFQHTLGFQYHLLASTGLFVAAAVGVPKVATFPRPRKIVFAAAMSAAALLALGGGFDVHTRWAPTQYRDTARVDRALDLVPIDAAVAASVRLLPHLSHRVELYTLPEPFVPVDWGGSSTAAELRARSRDVRYVVFVAGDGPSEYPRRLGGAVLSLIRRNGFAPIYRDGPIVVLERRST